MTGLVDELEALIPFLESHHCSAEPIRKAVAQMTTVSPDKDEVERHVETLARMKFKTMPKAQWDAISAAQDALEAAALLQSKDEVGPTDAQVRAHHRYRNLWDDFQTVEKDLRACALLIGHHYNSLRPVSEKLRERLAAMSPVDRALPLREQIGIALMNLRIYPKDKKPPFRVGYSREAFLRAADAALSALSSPEPVGEVSE